MKKMSKKMQEEKRVKDKKAGKPKVHEVSEKRIKEYGNKKKK